MTQTVLLDLGNVVLGIDFRRVFTYWAKTGKVDEQRFYENWVMDDAYEAHEVGQLDFAAYSQHLSQVFDVQLSDEDWQRGWNDLWTEPFHKVTALLPRIAQRYPLYAFTNTNDTHAAEWRSRYPTELSPFQHIFVSSEIGLRKPDREAYHHVCDAMDTTPEKVLFLDDHPMNVSGALESGLNSVKVVGEDEVVAQLQTLLSIPDH